MQRICVDKHMDRQRGRMAHWMSVCLSVSVRYCTETTKRIIKQAINAEWQAFIQEITCGVKAGSKGHVTKRRMPWKRDIAGVEEIKMGRLVLFPMTKRSGSVVSCQHGPRRRPVRKRFLLYYGCQRLERLITVFYTNDLEWPQRSLRLLYIFLNSRPRKIYRPSTCYLGCVYRRVQEIVIDRTVTIFTVVTKLKDCSRSQVVTFSE